MQQQDISPILPPLHVDYQYMQNAKIARVLSKTTYEIATEERTKFNIPVAPEVINFVDLWLDENVELSSYNIGQFDMAVMDSIYTISKSGYQIFPIEWIIKILSGNESAKITEKQIKSVRDSIRKLRAIKITINCEAELFYRNILNDKSKKKSKLKDFIYSSAFLSVGEIQASYAANGKPVHAYKLLEMPPLYTYAEAIRQIISVSPDFFHTQEKFSDSTDAILIKRYVIRRIAQILNQNNSLHSRKISYLWYDNKSPDEPERGLFPELGYDPTGERIVDENGQPLSDEEKLAYAEHFRKKVKPKIKKVVEGTLETLVENDIISGFSPYKENGSKKNSVGIAGYEIICKED